MTSYPFYTPAALGSAVFLGAVGWWAIGIGNLVAVGAMGKWLIRTHPLLLHKLFEEPVTTRL